MSDAMKGRRQVPTMVREPLAAAAALIVFLRAVPAAATPNFPQDVDNDLMLTMKIETTFPTMGCRLCHPTESPPATNPPLKPFGNLLFEQYGVIPYDDGSLKSALAEVQRDHPDLIDDIKMGMDPNVDRSAPPPLPSPEYGCSTANASPQPLWTIWPLALVAIAPLARWLRRARRAR